MSRIRSIKPEYWADEKIASLTFPARLLAIALLNFADDEGFFNANEKLVKAFAFPLDDSVKIPVLLRELSGIGYVQVRSCQNGSKTGQNLGMVTHFLRHQYINKPKTSSLRPVWEASGTSTVGGTEASAQEGKGMEGKGKEQGRPSDDGRFGEFWSKYPRRAKKQAAVKAWAKLSEEDRNRVLSVLPSWPFDPREDGRFIPHPASWLNEKRWEDEAVAPATPERKVILGGLGAKE